MLQYKMVLPPGLSRDPQGASPLQFSVTPDSPTIGKHFVFAKRERGTTEGKTNKQT